MALASGLLLTLLLYDCRGGQPPGSHGSSTETDDAAADQAMIEGLWERSVELHRALLRREPGKGLTMYHLGFSEGSLGRHRAEVTWYERAQAAGYRSPDMLYNRGLAHLELGELRAAGEALDAALAARPKEAEFHYAAARVALARRDDASAQEHLESATRLDPAHAEAWEALAALYERRNDHEAARAARAHIR